DPDNPADTTLLYFSEDFRTELDWNTGINLPTLFPSTWKLQPTVGIRNVTGGAFLLRNRFTDGRFVAQGKRVSFGAGLSPTLFGFLPGVGPVTRVRHALSPIVSWSYAPSASVPEAYARAQDPSGSAARESPALHSISFGLSQTFEGKLRRAEGDTTDATPQRKVKLLSVQTSSVSYDFEQAKEEGRNGWRTQTLTNRLTSDLLPGFTLSLTHDLWDGPVGFDDTDFSPALTSVSARFSLSSRTFQRIVGLLAGGAAPVEVGEPSVADEPFDFQDGITPAGTGLGPRPGLDPTFDRMTSGRRRGGGLEASFTYDDRRSRTGGNANRTLGMS
ncbi:MAG: hypothetical protein GTN83_14835, partial [Acidobacteria bacterium]|nr:hypothetical protein [Acidobacteriota bacterium]